MAEEGNERIPTDDEIIDGAFTKDQFLFVVHQFDKMQERAENAEHELRQAKLDRTVLVCAELQTEYNKLREQLCYASELIDSLRFLRHVRPEVALLWSRYESLYPPCQPTESPNTPPEPPQ